MSDNQTIKDRLIIYIKWLGIGQGKFEKNCDLANGYVNNIRKSISPEKLQKIALHNPQLNTGWLMTGEGNMLRNNEILSGDNSTQVAGNQNNVNSSATIELALKEISEMRKLIQEQIKINQEQFNSLMRVIEKLTK